MISPPREQATLFWPEPQTGFTNGLPAKERKQEPIDYGQEVIKEITEAVAEARHNPETLTVRAGGLWEARPRIPGTSAR